jgi:hypothetical protein
MIASEFSQFADDLIREMGPHLRKLAQDFFHEHGRGAVKIELHDASDPEERASNIDYALLEKWPVASHPRHLISEYDPERELVLHIWIDGMALTRRLRFGELSHPAPNKPLASMSGILRTAMSS